MIIFAYIKDCLSNYFNVAHFVVTTLPLEISGVMLV